MSLVKRVTRSAPVQSVLCWVAAQYIRLLHATGRWQVDGGDIPAGYWDQGKPFILAFWHGRLLMMPYAWRRGVPIHMLISQHRDGQLIAKTVAHFGITWLAGSSSKGGSAALRAMLKALKSGESVGITPDGPRGPRMRASSGIVNIAKLSGCAIIPASFAAEKRKVLGSWDRFVVAKPFTRGVFLWGQPIEVPRDADDAQLETIRATVEASLNALTAEADARMGHAAIAPTEVTP